MCKFAADRAQAAEVLIKLGKADLEAEDDIGRTAVSHAAKYGSVDCLNLLGNAHADVFHKDKEGKTPLQIAEISSRSEAVLALKKWQQVSASFTAMYCQCHCCAWLTYSVIQSCLGCLLLPCLPADAFVFARELMYACWILPGNMY